MNFVIIGLGNFGSALGISLTGKGHDVIAVDNNMSKVEAYKNVITHTIMLNARDVISLKTLPLKDSDYVIVGIGEDFGASIEVTAHLKQMKVKQLIARAISPVHQTVLEAIGVDEIIHPEEETAERLAKRITMKGVLDSFDITEKFKIIETDIPKRYIGKTVEEVQLRNKYNLNIVTIIKRDTVRNALGVLKKKEKVAGVISPDRVFEEDDILVLFGEIADIDKLLKRNA